MKTVFLALLLLSSVGIIFATVLMDPKSEGMGSITGSAEQLLGKQSRGKDKLLNTVTVACGIVFAVSTILVTVLSK